MAPFDRQIISKFQQDYSGIAPRRAPGGRQSFFGLGGSRREARAGDRILNRAQSGVSLERFRKILERENCRIENIDVSDDKDMVIIDFVFVEDDGHCLAILTDHLSNDTYVRCCLTARFQVDLPARQVNELNQSSKFLKFYDVGDGRLFAEYSILMIDLPDGAVAANLDMFHGSVIFIVRNRFSYEIPQPSGPKSDGQHSDVYTALATSQKLADLSRSDLNSIESKLDRIAGSLDRGPGGDLQAVINRLEDIRSLLRDISGKLDRH